MKSQHLAAGTRLAFSLVMALAYSGLLAGLLALHPGAERPSNASAGIGQAPLGALAVPPPKASAPGSLRLRMTLPYLPGGGARPADQEI